MKGIWYGAPPKPSPRWAGIAPEASLHLDKRVPYGAGLGSGSSDAAATLRLLSSLWRLDVPEAEMHRLASGLGADVPFFLTEGPALGTGLGADLAPLLGTDGSLWRCPFWLVVAVPPVHVSTAEAYALVSPEARDRPDLSAAVVSNDLSRWRREVGNDFEAPVVARHPEIGGALEAPPQRARVGRRSRALAAPSSARSSTSRRQRRGPLVRPEHARVGGAASGAGLSAIASRVAPRTHAPLAPEVQPSSSRSISSAAATRSSSIPASFSCCAT